VATLDDCTANNANKVQSYDACANNVGEGTLACDDAIWEIDTAAPTYTTTFELPADNFC